MKNLLLVLLALSLVGCAEQVDEGYRGIKTNWGEVVGEPLTPGLYFYMPVASNIFEMSVKEEKLESQSECFTKDTQKVIVSYVVTYYPEQVKIGELYKQFGTSWYEKVIPQVVLGSLKDSIGQYIADELVQKREVVKKTAEKELKGSKELKDSLAARGVVVTRLDLTNLDFDDAYEKAVEAKVVAIQKAIEAKNKTVEVEEQAKQTVMSAKADAEAMRIKSNALAQSKSLVEYEIATRWDGELPTIVGPGAMPMIGDLNSFMKRNKSE
jgi:regulator of protease activity HflC (stomatin/prohibitin superfamily)